MAVKLPRLPRPGLPHVTRHHTLRASLKHTFFSASTIGRGVPLQHGLGTSVPSSPEVMAHFFCSLSASHTPSFAYLSSWYHISPPTLLGCIATRTEFSPSDTTRLSKMYTMATLPGNGLPALEKRAAYSILIFAICWHSKPGFTEV